MGDDTKGRFVKVPLSVVNAQISCAAFRVWCALAARCNAEGQCWPGKGRLAEDTGLSKNTLHRAVAELEAAGLLLVEHRRVEEGRHYSNMYTVVDNCGGRSNIDLGRSKTDLGGRSKMGPELESFRTRHKRTSESSRTQHPVDCPAGCDGTGWIETGPRTVNHCPGGQQ